MNCLVFFQISCLVNDWGRLWREYRFGAYQLKFIGNYTRFYSYIEYFCANFAPNQEKNLMWTLNSSHIIKSMSYVVKIILKFPLAPMGVLAPGSAHARPSARPPIDVSGNFPAHVSAESPSNISPNPSEVISKVSEPQDNF